MEIHTHTFSRFSRSGISTFHYWSQGLANETWNHKCESHHSSFLVQNANGKPSSETSRPLVTFSLAANWPLNGQKRLVPLAERSTCSKSTLSLLIPDHIFRAIDQKQLTAMVLIDLSKAFDSICHSTLLLKLHSLGTSSQALKWFESYLTDREQSTQLGTSLSDELMITHGMPQGSILGPMLFNLYIKLMIYPSSTVKSSCTDSYIDNTKIYRFFSAKNMNSCLCLIAGWCCSH